MKYSLIKYLRKLVVEVLRVRPNIQVAQPFRYLFIFLLVSLNQLSNLILRLSSLAVPYRKLIQSRLVKRARQAQLFSVLQQICLETLENLLREVQLLFYYLGLVHHVRVA